MCKTTRKCTSSPWWYVKTAATLGLSATIGYEGMRGYWVPHALLWPGQGLVLAGFAIHLYHARLLRRHQARYGTGHLLTSRGWFTRLRHPMYLAEGIIGAGMAMVLCSQAGGLLLVLQWGAIGLQSQREDGVMGRLFGESFKQWKIKTGLLLPRSRG